MTGVVNQTGARSGAVGTIVGTPAHTETNAANVGSGVLPVGVTGGSGLTALGTIASGVWKGTEISQVAHKVINWSNDYSIGTTIELWNGTASRINMTMIKANAKILFTATGTEGKMGTSADYFKLFMAAKVGNDSLAATPSGHMESDYQMIYARSTNQQHFASITGGITLTNSIGDVVCFAPAAGRVSGSGSIYTCYVGSNGRGNFTIAEIH